ncbi:hypothetical protein NY547_04895 [Cnuibacter physcomitrellae]|uniref:hypothetical protein n=1 Tax=Cnuibacter physcomitrellae TaxID=1619308 RepID=UPI002175B93F|nr:hypothetical protein [Cnuibacter physcomitrellae]MCS5496576.1 hypothetical protein [Cnuibacter physcomitrellae]
MTTTNEAKALDLADASGVDGSVGHRRRRRRGWMAAVGATLAALFTATATAPASASDLTVVSVGTSSLVSGNTDYQDYGTTFTLAVVGHWSGHTLESIDICSGALGDLDTIYVNALAYTQDGTTVELGAKDVVSTDCQSWSIGTSYTPASDGELVRIWADVTYAAGQHRQTVSFVQ